MVSKISFYLAWIGLGVVVLAKSLQLWGAISIDDLVLRVTLWGFGSFFFLILMGKVVDGLITLRQKKEDTAPTVDYTLEAATPQPEGQRGEERAEEE
jgi:hypothetical protein